MHTPEGLLELAVDVAREAGALAHRRREEGVEIAATKSGLADIVTEADREVERLIKERLAAERPQDGFLGEESGADFGSSALTWVVDPIDGTVNYAYGIPAYAVSIAVVEGDPTPGRWTTLAGVVDNPATGEVFTAALGLGAHLGARRLAVNAEPDASGALIATGFGYDPQKRIEQFAVLQRVLPLARDIRRMGAASLDLASVAAGRVDAYYERGLWPWDHAAGALLVTEAGGRVGGISGAAEGRDLLIAAAPAFFDVLEGAIRG
ncbi:MAG: inositol monophosphatase family protein [Ilumatobacteraceae bacterium]